MVDVAIVGGGPAGLFAALALTKSSQNFKVKVCQLLVAGALGTPTQISTKDRRQPVAEALDHYPRRLIWWCCRYSSEPAAFQASRGSLVWMSTP